MKKIPDFFSDEPTTLEKAEKQMRIKLKEGANKGRQANVVGENDREFDIAPRTGQKPFKVPATGGGVKTAPNKAALGWAKGRKHEVIQEGKAAPKSQLATPQTESYESEQNPDKPKAKKRVFAAGDAHKFMPHSDKQKELIEGIDMAEVRPHGEGWTSDWAISGFGKNKSGKEVVFKGRMPESQYEDVGYGDHFEKLTTAQREGLYHNVAHFMGLGKYVPTTSVIHDRSPGADPVSQDHGPNGNHYSVMEKIPGARHYTGGEGHRKVLGELHESGELHKLAIMNAMLGNTDRHSQNWMMSPQGLHLIDHGLTFDYNNRDRSFVFPGYLEEAQAINSVHKDPLHESARDWLLGLDHGELKKLMASHKVHNDFKRPLMEGLLMAQDRVRSDPKIRIDRLLSDISDHVRSFRKK